MFLWSRNCCYRESQHSQIRTLSCEKQKTSKFSQFRNSRESRPKHWQGRRECGTARSTEQAGRETPEKRTHCKHCWYNNGNITTFCNNNNHNYPCDYSISPCQAFLINTRVQPRISCHCCIINNVIEIKWIRNLLREILKLKLKSY